MKRIPDSVITTYKGYPMQTLERDVSGKVVFEDEEKQAPKLKDCRLSDCIEILADFMHNYKEKTGKDSVEVVRLFGQILDSKDGILNIEEAEHDWLKDKLNDEKVGLQIFGMNLQKVKEAVDSFERPHVAKEE